MDEGKYGIRKRRREGRTWEERVEGCERKYAGGGTWSGHAQQDFGRGSAGQNGKYGNVERDTCKRTIVGGEIGKRAKAHKG